jgi:hypothetical protein
MPPLTPAALFVCLILATLAPAVVSAQDPPPPPQDPATMQPPLWAGGKRRVELFPAGDVFPVYVADPHRPTNQLSMGALNRIRIPESDSPRIHLAGGGRFGLVRVGGAAPESWAWQLSLDAGLDAVFDSSFKNDGIGWDGNYGATFTVASPARPFSFKLAVLHLSAHLGDEYEMRTDIDRINYTREEVAFGVAWRPRRPLRLYGEYGIAYLMRDDRQEPGRFQAGIEYEGRPRVLSNRAAWYGAVDFSMLEERDWHLDTSIQGGMVFRNNGRAIRLFGQWYDGRPPLGQFTWYSESTLSIGIRVDL